MDANEFVTKLKANGNQNDWCDIQKVNEEYKLVINKLSTKNKCSFSLNVLCILCRNLDKAPTWRDNIDAKQLLLLSIDCVRETRGSERPERVKTLACVYHIHKHIVKQSNGLPPELVLKLSFMPFENDDLLREYCKTYWNIIADRFTYTEKLKSKQMPIIKLLPKLTEDILKVTHIYDTVSFCSNILPFIVKRLHYLYSDSYAKDINVTIGKVFEAITSKKDLQLFKALKQPEIIDLYLRFNECFYVIADNSVKLMFKDSVLSTSVRCCIKLLGHHPDMFHCLQTFYLNCFCCILTENCNTIVLETVVNLCKMTEKLGYMKAMTYTYPYLNQLLRLYIEYITNNSDKISWKENFDEMVQESCLNIIEFLMKKLRSTPQMSKCEGCPVKSGLHDGLRLSFLVRYFISTSLAQGISIERILPVYKRIILDQHNILNELKMVGCVNYEKCYRKLQTDTHNTSISLNKAQIFEFSIQLFDIYLENEIKNFQMDIELKNISRALYNKSICEMDNRKYENALRDAFLSFTLAVPESLNSEKYMSLVMDIKAKALKQQTPDSCDDEDEEKQEDVKNDDVQLMNVFEACRQVLEDSIYAKLKPVLTHLKFSELLKHEFKMYTKLWPSILPIAGVWRALQDLSMNKYPEWVVGETQDSISSTLYDVILSTAFSVRTIHSDYFGSIVDQLISGFESNKPNDSLLKIIHASLLVLKCETNLAKAQLKYGWNSSENADTDLGQVRTVPQEYEAILPGLKAVDVWTEALGTLKTVPPAPILRNALKVASVLVRELELLYQTAPALQLAHVCCKVADYVGDHEEYLRNFGVILSHCWTLDPKIVGLLKECLKKCKQLISEGDIEVSAIFFCEAALFYNRCGEVGLSARLIRFVQSRVISVLQKDPEKKFDLVLGRLLDAQTQLCLDSAPSTLSAVNSVQRHYIAIPNTETSWLPRRLQTLTVSWRSACSTLRAVRVWRRLRSWPRARAAAVAGRGALHRGLLVADTVNAWQSDDAQVKIDNRLKHILGLQPSNEIQSQAISTESIIKQQMFTPKQNRLETMLEHVHFKKTQTSPTFAGAPVPGFQMPEYMTHEKECACFSCKTAYCLILAYKTFGLEAAVYFRANEVDIAQNYFSGVLDNFDNVKVKLQNALDSYKANCEGYIVDVVRDEFLNDLNKCQVDVLIEAAYFALSLGDHEKSEAYLSEIRKLSQNLSDSYVKNEILNLTIVFDRTRNKTKKATTLEIEMDNLKLTPTKAFVEPQKTPETKPSKPPKIKEIKLVSDEELPKLRRKVIKLNLDDNEDSTKKPSTRSNRLFKIPVPVTSKPVLENIGTPIPVKSRPVISVTKSSDEKVKDISNFATPNTDQSKSEFFTPNATPGEQFFTPSTSIKTYAKKSLRHNIIKNLENEFSTPKAAKEDTKEKLEVPLKSRRNKVDEKTKRTLKRATSPGKIVKEEKSAPIRSRRVKPDLSVDKENEK